MFIAVLFTIAKVWKQPRCPSTDEWIKNMCKELDTTKWLSMCTHTPTFYIMECLLLLFSHYVVSDSCRPQPVRFLCPRQEYWSGLPFPSPGDLLFPTQGSNLCLLLDRQILYQGITWEAQWNTDQP